MVLDDTMCYAARFPGTVGYGAVSVDNPAHKKDTAKDIARWILDGAIVERVALGVAQKGMGEYIAARKAQAAK